MVYMCRLDRAMEIVAIGEWAVVDRSKRAFCSSNLHRSAIPCFGPRFGRNVPGWKILRI